MTHFVQVELQSGVTHMYGWFDCKQILSWKDKTWTIVNIWPQTILEDSKGVDGSDVRSVCSDSQAYRYTNTLKQIVMGFRTMDRFKEVFERLA